MTVDLGRAGIWSRELRYHPDRGARAAAAAELEDLGYSAIFIPDAGGDVLGAVGHLLAATRRIPFATGVLNIWMHDPAEVASRHASLLARFGPRFLLGLGNSHAPLVESALGVPYARPYSKMTAYLDALDAAEPPVPAPMRMLAALGPRMLSLARGAGGRGASVPGPARAHGRRPPGARPRRAARTGAGRGARSPIRGAAARSGQGLRQRLSRPAQLRAQPPPPRLHRRRPGRPGAATGSSTRWSPAATRTRSRPGSARTSTRAPITCASTSSAATDEALPLDAWRRLAPGTDRGSLPDRAGS